MYCPGCGSEERQMSQYCRGCGTDLRPVRLSLERPDSVTASAVSAREEIGHVFAEKIREVESSRDLKRIAEDVLPQIEKFLESPEEKRLRRMRAGVITAACGLGATVLAGLLLSVIRNPQDPIRFPCSCSCWTRCGLLCSWSPGAEWSMVDSARPRVLEMLPLNRLRRLVGSYVLRTAAKAGSRKAGLDSLACNI